MPSVRKDLGVPTYGVPVLIYYPPKKYGYIADSRVATSGKDKRLKHIQHEAWFTMFT